MEGIPIEVSSWLFWSEVRVPEMLNKVLVGFGTLSDGVDDDEAGVVLRIKYDDFGRSLILYKN